MTREKILNLEESWKGDRFKNLHNNDMYSDKEIGEILEAVNATVPDLLTKL